MDSLERIAVFSYYHPWIAGGGHRPHHLLLEDLRRGREVVFICASATGVDDVVGFLEASGEIYKRLAVFVLDGADERTLLARSPFASALQREDRDFPALLERWTPGYARAHNPCAALLPLVRDLGVHRIPFVYDQMDLWSAFAVQPWGSGEIEAEYLRRADAVITVSGCLARNLPTGVCGHVIANAVSESFLAAIESGREGAERAATLPKQATYVGALWPDWFDWNLCEYLARERPDVRFTFVGPTVASSDEHDGRPTRRLAETLAARRNVTMVPEIPHEEVARWLLGADVGILPFLVNPLTEAASPLKVFEYVGAGLPVIGLRLPEIAEYPLMYLAGDYPAVLAQLDAADRRTLDSGTRRRACEFIEANTWARRIDALDAVVKGIA